jgi:hypothetical protein
MCFEWLWLVVLGVEREQLQKRQQNSESVQEFIATIQQRFNQRIDLLWTQSAQLQSQVRQCLRIKDTQRARAFVQQRLQVVKARDRCIGKWLQLSNVVLQLHTAKLAPQMVSALHAAKHNLAAHHLDIKEAEDVMEEMRDYHQLGDELNEALTAPIAGNEISAEDIQRELDTYQDNAPVVVSATPSVSSSSSKALLKSSIAIVDVRVSAADFMDSLTSDDSSSVQSSLLDSRAIDSVAN